MNTTAQKHQSIITVIAHCIENDESGIKSLLKRNGVDADGVSSKRELTKIFLESLSKSKPLALDFGKYVEAKKTYNLNMSANGEVVAIDLNGLSQGGTYNTIQPTSLNITSTNSSQPASSTTGITPPKSTGFFSNLNLNDLLNTGVKALELQRDIQVSKDNASAVEQAVQIKRDEMNLKPQSSNSKTGLYVFLGIATLAAIGITIYLVKKKK